MATWKKEDNRSQHLPGKRKKKSDRHCYQEEVRRKK
jgi:hypothetical protein